MGSNCLSRLLHEAPGQVMPVVGIEAKELIPRAGADSAPIASSLRRLRDHGDSREAVVHDELLPGEAR